MSEVSYIRLVEKQKQAIRKLEVVDFPAIVAYDAEGGSVYEGIL